MRIVLVGGQANSAFIETFEKHKQIVISNTFNSINDLTSAVYESGITFLNSVDSILILDFAFLTGITSQRIELFIELQDMLTASGLSRTKLYLLTRNSDMYTGLQENVGGAPAILYINTEVMLIENQYPVKILTDIIMGKRDRMGLFHPDVDKNTLHSHMEMDKDKFIEDSRAVSSEILAYGKNEPFSVLSPEDYIDSPYTDKQVINRERSKRMAEREVKNKEKQNKNTKAKNSRNTKSSSRNVSFENSDTSNPSFDEDKPTRPNRKSSHELAQELAYPMEDIRRQRTLASQIDEDGVASLERDFDYDKLRQDENKGIGKDISDDSSELKSELTIRRLREKVEDKRKNGLVVSEKIANDSGVIAVYGDSQTGVSGFVANLAEVYGTAKRKVLIIDLDTVHRQQSAYFPNYAVKSKEFQGLSLGLLKASQGGSITYTAVDITSRVSILGMGITDNYNPSDDAIILSNIRRVIENAVNEYDIVILDIPHIRTFEYLEKIEDLVNMFVLVVSDLKYRNYTYFKNVLGNYVKVNTQLMDNVFKKSRVLVNKVNRNHILSNDSKHSNTEFGQWLVSLKYPFDRLYMLSEIPYYDEWELQYTTNIRHVWENTNLMYIFTDIINKMVWD